MWWESSRLDQAPELYFPVRNCSSHDRRRTLMPPVRPLLALLTCVQAVLGAESVGEQLTSAKEVLALPAERAESGIGVAVQGVVTAAQPDWGGRFFVQDPTAGIFVEFIGDRQPHPGDLVRVTGVSHPGGFAPIITQPS